MTLAEFIHPARKRPVWEICLAVLYFDLKHASHEGATVDGLRALLRQARVPRAAKLNIADILAKSSPYVDVSGKDGARFIWRITDTGQAHVREILGLASQDVEVEHDVFTLEKLAKAVPDQEIAAYLDESIKCLKVGALRAAVVFLWVGAARKIQEACFAAGIAPLNTALKRHDKNARDVKTLDDLCYSKESVLLEAAQDLGIFDKNQKGVLIENLNLRNKCGHPGQYRPGPKKVSSFVEDVIGIVFG